LTEKSDIALLHALGDAAREIGLRYFRSTFDLEAKAATEFDPVTNADREIEARIREILSEARPDDGILGEEGGGRSGMSDRVWVIDPIDGTRAFVAGLPTWCVLIAFDDGSGPQLGLIDQPFIGERFVGEIGHGGRWFRGDQSRPLQSNSSVIALADVNLATTDPGLFVGNEKDVFSELAQQVRIRRYGLDAYAYGALALGGLDLVVESGLQPWDVAALVPVVKASGGVMSNWSGGPCHQGGQVIAAANARIHGLALDILRPAAAY
jgi:histidinol phosphatase-like enzyme (inositol monophosphatase family)